ncbi:gas vesicle protein [Streptosporangium sp. NPDC000396]|uniref:gas vesicle protein n=1 Tax=Streptosporangium sp. NPDC000396 TaxID=3366185 RepID=UPI0036B318B2
MTNPARFGPGAPQPYGARAPAGRESSNLGDILERVLDRGVVIAGDIRVNLLDIELLTIKLRLLIASVDTARELGIDWWEHDPWLTSKDHDLIEENRRLRRRLAAMEGDQELERGEGTGGRSREVREREDYRSLERRGESGGRRSREVRDRED